MTLNPADVLRLHDAARRGSCEAINAILDQGIPVDAKGNYGDTALMAAAFHGRAESVELLLDRGAKADMEDTHGETALHWALETVGRELDLECVELLVRAGVSLEARNNRGESALLKCARSAVIYFDHSKPGTVLDCAPCLLLLMKLGADFNAVDNNQDSVRDIMDKNPRAFIAEDVAPVYAIMDSASMQRKTRAAPGEGRVRRI